MGRVGAEEEPRLTPDTTLPFPRAAIVCREASVAQGRERLRQSHRGLKKLVLPLD